MDKGRKMSMKIFFKVFIIYLAALDISCDMRDLWPASV